MIEEHHSLSFLGYCDLFSLENLEFYFIVQYEAIDIY